MPDMTRLLDAAAAGDRNAADLLRLRKLAAAKMAVETPGHTLDATALVHETYLRLVGPADEARWENRGHFFAAAAESMRRILVEAARRKRRLKHGRGLVRVDLESADPADASTADELLALDAALEKFAPTYPAHAQLVTLRYFAGQTLPEAARPLGISDSTADRYWAFAKAWLRAEIAYAGSDSS